MKTIVDFRNRKVEILKAWREIMDNADDNKRDLTPAENTRCEELNAELDEVNESIKTLEKTVGFRGRLEAEEADAARPAGLDIRGMWPSGAVSTSGLPLPGSIPGRVDIRSLDNGGFDDIGSMFISLVEWKRDGKMDPRLQRCREAQEARDQQMGVGATGGFAIPVQFSTMIQAVSSADAIVRPRATVIPAGATFPDAALSFPTLDQTASKNMWGGIVVVHGSEGVNLGETTGYLRDVVLEPKQISCYLTISGKLFRNAPALSAYLSQTLVDATQKTEDHDFLFGTGVNSALGMTNCSASLKLARTTANSITFADVVSMYSRVLQRGPMIWVGSPSIIPQLAAMTDSGGHAVWLGGSNTSGLAAQPVPQQLLGLPLLFNERIASLGNTGDLMLLAPQFYCVKDGSGPLVASSEHMLFTSDKIVMRIIWNVDGRPWLTEPITPEGGGSTLSPFIVLQ